MKKVNSDCILILDFGSQYTQLIARRVRELGVYSEVFPFDTAVANITKLAPKGIILSGGPDSTLQEEGPVPAIPSIVFELNIPVLGICYGMQSMAKQLGGQVIAGKHREFGHAVLELGASDQLISALGADLSVWMSHGDQVSALPAGFVATAKTNDCAIAAMADHARKYFGVQFHPEVTHTHTGAKLLASFIYEICKCEKTWTTHNIIEQSILDLRVQIGQEDVLLGLSGGVDSAVVAALLDRAIGSQLTCVFVDNGLLRLNEAEQVMAVFAEQKGLKVIKVDAQAQFFAALKGLSDPEEKRKAIGRVFIEVFEAQAKLQPKVKFLAQGTIYPDVIESAGVQGHGAKTIKSHHNVGGLPERLALKLVEPLRMLFKDEVRHIGEALGLPRSLLYRHPFPGPGLGVRILGEVHPEFCEILKQADAIFLAVLEKHNYYAKVSQAFAVFLPVKSVGVVGDARQYDYVLALRAVETIDFMTARWAELPYALLGEASTRILNEVRGVSRVCYDISSKPPATIEWE